MRVGIAWNAGSVRARLVAQHRVGRGAAGDLARCGSLEDALAGLRDGPYGRDLDRSATLAEAQWAIAATALWHLRILAGWVPPSGAELLRILVGWWEVRNVEGMLEGFATGAPARTHDLGRLETSWSRLRDASSSAQLRRALRGSTWGDPGGDEPGRIAAHLRRAWGERVQDLVAAAARPAAGWLALQAARSGPLDGRPADGRRSGAWVLAGIDDRHDLWRAEARWWRALEEDGARLVRHPRGGADAVVGAFDLLLADAHWVEGALALAARGGADEEVVHALL